MRQSSVVKVANPRQWISILITVGALLLPYQASAQLFYAPDNVNYSSLVSDNSVLVVEKKSAYWGFIPTDPETRTDVGIIYYAGTFYDERSYATTMRSLARNGARRVPTFILDLPLSLAFLAPFRADIVRRDFPEIKAWVVAGHGVGGAIASCYAQARNMEGLALFSSYPFPLLNNLKWNDISVISLWGNNDGVTSRQQWEDGRLALPGNTLFIEIAGGNHGQMARFQGNILVAGDRPAFISRARQQSIVVTQLKLLVLRIQERFDPDDDDCAHLSSSSSESSDSDSADGHFSFEDDKLEPDDDYFSQEDSESDSVSFDCGGKYFSKSDSADYNFDSDSQND